MLEAGHLGKPWPGTSFPRLLSVPWGAMAVIGALFSLGRVGVLPEEGDRWVI